MKKATGRIRVGRGVAVFLRWRKWWVDLYQRGRRVQYPLGTEDQGEAVSAGVALLRDIESGKFDISTIQMIAKENSMANKRKPVAGPDQKPLWCKPISEMTFDEKLSWATGTILFSIGDGKLRSGVSVIILGVSQEAFDRGVKSGVEREKIRAKEAAQRRRKQARKK